MRKFTVLIARANGIDDFEDLNRLDAVLIDQAGKGITIQQALDGHCADAAANRVFTARLVSVLSNEDGVMVTLSSPLQSVIHEMADEHDVPRGVDMTPKARVEVVEARPVQKERVEVKLGKSFWD